MQTMVLSGSIVGSPSLESDGERGHPERTVLESFPFVVGRNDSTSLPLNSPRVSREHAEIVRDGRVYRVRDLGSTNGTFVNGQRVKEAELADGDLLQFADVEFTFRVGQTGASRQTVTQVIDADELPSKSDSGAAVIRETRRLGEAVLNQSLRPILHPIVDLRKECLVACSVASAPYDLNPRTASVARAILKTHGRLASRVRHATRLAALQTVARVDSHSLVFLELDSGEIGSPQVVAALRSLADELRDPQQLVVEMSDSLVTDLPYFRDFYDRLRRAELRIAYADFAGSQARIREHASVMPDYIKASKSMIRGIGEHPDRQEKLTALVQGLAETKGQVIAAGILTDSEIESCRQAGCLLGEGEYFADRVQPLQA